MYKIFYIDTFNGDNDLMEIEFMPESEFKTKAQNQEFDNDSFDAAFDEALDMAYVHGKSVLENTDTGRDYLIDRDSDEVQVMTLARNHRKVNFKDVIEGVKADSKKFARDYLDQE